MVETPSERSPSSTAGGSRGRWWLTVLYVILLAGAVLTALRWRRGTDSADLELPGDGRYVGTSASVEEPAAIAPDSLIDEPELIELDRPPADLTMPAGATLRSIVAYRALGSEQIKAEYSATGEFAAVAESLAAQLAELGWREADAAGLAPRETNEQRRLLFMKAGDVLNLHLNREGLCVMIVAVIHRHGVADPLER